MIEAMTEAPMDDPLVLAARREREQLKKKLADINSRVAELDTFLRISTTISTHDQSPDSLVDSSVDDAALTMFTARATAPTIKEQVLRTSADLIATNNRPLQTHELVQALESRGIFLNGKDKVLQVSAILSKAKDVFVASRKQGWSLATKDKGPGALTPEPLGAVAADPQPHP